MNVLKMSKYIIHIITIGLISISLFALLFIQSSGRLGNVQARMYDTDPIDFYQPVITKLLSRGIDSSFVYSIVADNRTKFSERYVKINVTGYLKKADYSELVSENSADISRAFAIRYESKLSEAQKKFGVDKEVIAAIIWIETRFGGYVGNNHIPSVYLSTAMAGQPEFIELNYCELEEKMPDANQMVKDSLRMKISERANKKSDWAINELVALSKINQSGDIDIMNLYGSWAGAFGLSQFLPSSYLNWAVDGDKDGHINLFDIDDAIYSVANYLKDNGWGNSSKLKRTSVFRYNNSNDYVDAVFTLADKIKVTDISIPLSRQLRSWSYLEDTTTR
jgi:membrane-bound lytic murein transglycosylase B